MGFLENLMAYLFWMIVTIMSAHLSQKMIFAKVKQFQISLEELILIKIIKNTCANTTGLNSGVSFFICLW